MFLLIFTYVGGSCLIFTFLLLFKLLPRQRPLSHGADREGLQLLVRYFLKNAPQEEHESEGE